MEKQTTFTAPTRTIQNISPSNFEPVNFKIGEKENIEYPKESSWIYFVIPRKNKSSNWNAKIGNLFSYFNYVINKFATHISLPADTFFENYLIIGKPNN
jgi:acetyltransferase-like isoleucine patch superfamily enzyme